MRRETVIHILFLETNGEALRDLIARAVTPKPILDFGVARLAGELGIGIELSQYTTDEESPS